MKLKTPEQNPGLWVWCYANGRHVKHYCGEICLHMSYGPTFNPENIRRGDVTMVGGN